MHFPTITNTCKKVKQHKQIKKINILFNLVRKPIMKTYLSNNDTKKSQDNPWILLFIPSIVGLQ